MEIKVVGPGCANCARLFELASRAVEELHIEARIEKVTGLQEIMKYTMNTPALVLNGVLKHAGKPLPSLDKVKELIQTEIR